MEAELRSWPWPSSFVFPTQLKNKLTVETVDQTPPFVFLSAVMQEWAWPR